MTATTNAADVEQDTKKRYSLAEAIGYLIVSEKSPTAAALIGGLSFLWSAVNLILAAFLIIPMIIVKSTINRVTRLDTEFDEKNPEFWNPFNNIMFNGIILLMGPIAVVVLAKCYSWVAARWNVVKALVVYIVMFGALALEGFRIAYLVNDILHHTDEWDQGTYTIAYVFCSIEGLFALLFIFGTKNIIARERKSSRIKHTVEKPSAV